jgi:putative ABC transport system ATP-binding protein
MNTVAPASLTAPVLALQGLRKDRSAFRPLIAGLDLQLARGEILIVRGAAQCGRSLLLRLIAGLETPDAGSVRVAGEDLFRLGPRGRRQLRRSMGLLLAGVGLVGDWSARENLVAAARLAGAGAGEARERAMAALDRLGVAHTAELRCAGLATGLAHRVALARALVHRPALLLLDDPFDPLDAAGAASVADVLLQFAGAGVAVLVTDRGLGGPGPQALGGARSATLVDGSWAA